MWKTFPCTARPHQNICGNAFVIYLSLLALIVSIVALRLALFERVQHNNMQTRDHSSHVNVSSLKSQINKMFQLEENHNKVIKTYNGNRTSKHGPISVFKMLKKPSYGASSAHKGSHYTLEIRDDEFNDDTEHVRGVHVKRDALVIQYTGLYYLYSQVATESNQTVFVYLHRVSPNSPKDSGVLLRGANSDPKRMDMVFIGGVFLMNSEDIVEICLGSESDVTISKHSFFGLFMLSSTFHA